MLAVWLTLVIASVTASRLHEPRITIMPFGDSLTTCCHSCEVAAEALPQDLRRSSAVEPRTAYEGYMRPLWHLLAQLPPTSSRWPPPLAFDYVGRNTDCIFARKNNGTRATTDDWPVRFEGHYGHTTKMILKKRIALAAVEAAINATGRPPDVTLLHLGTNDLLLGKGRYVGGKIEALVRQFAFGHSGNADGVSEGACARWLKQPRTSRVLPRRAVVLALPMPVDFGHVLMGAGAGDGMRARRRRGVLQQGLHGAIAEAVTHLAAVSRRQVPGPRWRQDDRAVDAAVGAVVAETWPVLGQWPVRGSVCGHQHQPLPPGAAETSRESEVDLVLVDMFSPGVSTVSADAKRAFGDPSVSAKTLLHGDGVHPNAAGERRMAERYASAIRRLLLRAWPPPTEGVDSHSSSAAAAAYGATTTAPHPVSAGIATAAENERNGLGQDIGEVTEHIASPANVVATQPVFVVLAVAVALVMCFCLRRRKLRL
jgi:lysophospholipase L1-like esterase